MSGTELILAATDWSENARRAIQRAAQIAARRTAQGLLLHVNESVWPLNLLSGANPGYARHSAGRLEKLAQSIRHQTGISFATQLQHGDAASCISKVARIKNASLITVGRWTDTALIRWTDTPFEQSISLKLLDKSTVPVLIAKADPVAPYRRVLVAIDGSQHSAACIEQARALAPDAELVLVHAIEGATEKRHRFEPHDERYRQLRVQRYEDALDKLHALLVQADMAPHRVVKVVECTYAPKFILDMEQEFAVDLIVLGRRMKSRFRRLFFNGVSSQVLARSQCDVLMVPPTAKTPERVSGAAAAP